MVAAGGLLVLAFVSSRPRTDLAGYDAQVLRCPRVAAAVTGVAALVLIPLTYSQLVGRPVSSLGFVDLLTFATQTEPGAVLLLQAILAICAALVLTRSPGTRVALELLVVVVTATALVPALTGHSYAADQNRVVVVAALALHVVAATVWVGGLVGLALLVRGARSVLAEAVTGFSSLALVCVVLVLGSGLVNVALRLDSWAALVTEWYGRLVLAKVVALIALSCIGFTHRRRTIPALRGGDRSPLLRLAAAEILLMAMTVGLAVGLSHTPGG